MGNYLIELAIVHTLLTLGYWFCLKQEQQYAKMRFYLITATCLSLIIPLLHIPISFGREAEPMPIITSLQTLSIDTTPMTSEETSFWKMELIKWVYLLISSLFLIKILVSFAYLVRLDKKSRYEKFQHLYIRRVHGINGSFSFLNRIFLSESIEKNQTEYKTILKHEKAHVDLGHSYDILFFEVFRMLFWWLPGSWYIREEIRKIHEYQADQQALKTLDPEEYATILISSTLKLNGLALASSFHDGLITQRLKAMKTTVKILSPWKTGILGLLLISLFVLFACHEDIEGKVSTTGAESTAIMFSELPQELQEKYKEHRQDLSFLRIIVSEDTKVSEVYDQINKQQKVGSVVHFKPNEIYIISGNGQDSQKHVTKVSKEKHVQGDIYTIVDEAPEYPGGLDAYYAHVKRKMNYPPLAKEQGLEGRVYVQFLVEKDGSVSNVEAVKGIGHGCDEEAVRLIRTLKRFSAPSHEGELVRVRMVLPVTFKLDSESSAI